MKKLEQQRQRERIKIAFCDDDCWALSEMTELLAQYCAEKNQKIDSTIFHSSLELLAEIERGTRFDILYLDILMPGQNGIEVAAEIRQYDTNVKIIFLTSSSEFAVKSYTVDAYFYQMKPICSEKFFQLMDSVLSACRKEQKSSLILRCKGGITRVELQRLEYCEVVHRTLFLHLVDGKVLESSGSLEDLSNQLLPYGNFFRPHRSYLVNLQSVQQLSYRAITMACGVEIPIPRGKYSQMKDAFLAYAFEQEQVKL